VAEQTRTLAAALEAAARAVDQKQAELVHLARRDLARAKTILKQRGPAAGAER